MNAKIFFKLHRKSISKKIKYQQRIDNLDQESIDSLISEIKANHCNDKETLRVTLYMIRKASFAHPKKIFLYLHVIENIIDRIKFFFTGDELAVIFRFISNKLIFLKLYNLKAIEFESVLKTIESFHFNVTCIEPLIYFYPEVKKYHVQLYLMARPIIDMEIKNSFQKDNQSFYLESVEDNIMDIINTNLFQINKNNEESITTNDYLCDDPNVIQKFIRLREHGEIQNPLAIAIKNDDIDTFQLLLSKNNISVNSCIKYTIFEQCNVVNKRKLTSQPRLIEYAAFFGSVKIFKFLLNTAQLTEKIVKNAIKGGNYEIIHLCENYKINFSPKCLILAIRFHRNEIVDYLLSNYSFQFSLETTIASIQYYNWEILSHCIPIYLQPDPNANFDNFSALATASINGYLDIVKLLCSLENIDINSTSEGWNPVMYAAFKGYTYLLDFFLAHFKSLDVPDDFRKDKGDIETIFYDIDNTNDDDNNNFSSDYDVANAEEEIEDTENDTENNEEDQSGSEKNDTKTNNKDSDNNELLVEDEPNETKISNIIDLNQVWDNYTPLEIAVYNQKLNVVQYLLQFKNVFEKSKEMTDHLIEEAHKKGYEKIENYLIETFKNS